MAAWSDLPTLFRLAAGLPRGASHADRMERFYRRQAVTYDSFRARLLAGRCDLVEALPAPEGGTWVDLGGGTGANAEHLGDRLFRLSRYVIVDLSESMLEVARRRIAARGWSNVEVVQADATRVVLAEGCADVVLCSYAITMIPDWFAAVDRARSLLGPGGRIGVVDFLVSRPQAPPGFSQHGLATRLFWPAWFCWTGVRINPDHPHYLHRRFSVERYEERRARMPYMLGLTVPYYLFIGRK
jgi:S-adenosylmethionine-diacylgycerolhomoserine-N-methlytransferase